MLYLYMLHYLVCDDMMLQGEPRDLQIKTQVGGNGQVKRIYMAVYEDQGTAESPAMMLVPSETWLLVVESVKKVLTNKTNSNM